MGCCLSRAGEERHCSDGGAIPVTLEEEESVKEVLLEIPLSTRKLNADEFIIEKGPGKQELKIDGGFSPPPLTNVFIQTDPQKLYTEETFSEEVSNDNECYSNTSAHEMNDGEVNQRRPLRKRRKPIGDKRRVPARTPVDTDKTSQVRTFRGGQLQLRNEGSVQRSRPPMTRGGRGTQRRFSGELDSSGGSNGVVLGEEPV